MLGVSRNDRARQTMKVFGAELMPHTRMQRNHARDLAENMQRAARASTPVRQRRQPAHPLRDDRPSSCGSRSAGASRNFVSDGHDGITGVRGSEGEEFAAITARSRASTAIPHPVRPPEYLPKITTQPRWTSVCEPARGRGRGAVAWRA
jgi:hypothetical protein